MRMPFLRKMLVFETTPWHAILVFPININIIQKPLVIKCLIVKFVFRLHELSTRYMDRHQVGSAPSSPICISKSCRIGMKTMVILTIQTDSPLYDMPTTWNRMAVHIMFAPSCVIGPPTHQLKNINHIVDRNDYSHRFPLLFA